MKVSIITPTYNSQRYIAETIESVLKQKHRPYEYFIIDSLSTDNTISIAKSYTDKFNLYGIKFTIISEKDSGMYAAINKGFVQASGDLIGYINSDDYYSSETLSVVVSEFVDSNVDWVHGYANFVDKNSKKLYSLRTISYNTIFFKSASSSLVFQPTCFFRRSIISSLQFNESYKLAADYDFIVRVGCKFKSKLIRRYLVNFRLHNETLTSKQAYLSRLEMLLIKSQITLGNPVLFRVLGLFGWLAFKVVNLDNYILRIIRVSIKVS